jgi:hypothetical protein
VLGDVVGIPPDAYGLADHEVISAGWEAASGELSVIDALLAQLRNPPRR